MPGTTTTGSANIAILDSKIIVDLCAGKFKIDIIPSTFIGTGAEDIRGANVKIVNPLGVTVKNYGPNYDITPGLSGEGIEQVVEFNVPTTAGNYMYGTYMVYVQVYDADGATWIVEKPVTICEPDSKNKTRNYGSLSANLKGVCKDGKLYVIVDTVPVYKGVIAESQVNDFSLEFPTSSGIEKMEDVTQGNFSVQLFEGIYKFNGTICALYSFGDNVFVKVNYKVKREKPIKCLIDECCVLAQLEEINSRLDTDCSDKEKGETANIILETLSLLKLIELKANCGEDPSDHISRIEELLGCSCTCNCNEGVPLINNNPSRDITISGCNVQKTSLGLTDAYVINNYSYVVGIAENGGALTVAAATLNGCVVTQQITFNISAVYTQIKSQVNNLAEYTAWAEFISNVLDGLDTSCIGVTAQAWAAMTFRERFAALIASKCTGGTCDAGLRTVSVTQVASTLYFTWQTVPAGLGTVIYLDGQLIATLLGTETSFEYPVPTNTDRTFQYRIAPVCSNGVIGTGEAGSVEVLRGTFVAPPEVYTQYLQQVVPYDLTTNVEPLPSGIVAEWHSANNTLASSLVGDPTQANPGTYFVFAKDSDGFYSTGVQVQLTANETGSCTAPQNLQVIPVFSGNQVQFKSAAYPPPSNSYTVKRRLKSDPDVSGSYTTIGTPVWNASANRWMINDTTAVANVLYTYRAISNCGGTAPYIDYDYAAIVCPTLTLTPHPTVIDYSFAPVGGEITKYEVTIYEDAGVNPIHTNTHLPSFSNPVTGSFAEYLTHNTNYWIGIKAYIGTYVKSCSLVQMATLKNTATLTIDYVAGFWSAVLSNPISEDLVLQAGVTIATGSNDDCATPFQTDTMPEMTLEAGELAVEAEGGDVDYLSEKYSIEDAVSIFDDAAGSLYEGPSAGTFVIDGITVTVIINHITCGYYPA